MVEACFKGFGRALRQPFAEMVTILSTRAVYDAIIDSGGANIASVQFALERLALLILTRDAAEIAAADRVLLPGSGLHSGDESSKRRAISAAIANYIKPVLGICLGMQLLFSRSFEGGTDLLGILDGACQNSLQPRAISATYGME